MSFVRPAGLDTARASHLRLGKGVAPRARILVVDDDDDARQALEKLLRSDGFATSAAADGDAALAEARRMRPDVALVDLQMAPMDGVELCKRLHEIERELPVIVMTGHSDMRSAIESLRERAEDYLVKPLHSDSVVWSIERALARRAARLEQEEAQRTLNERLVLSNVREQEHAEIAVQRAAELEALLGNLSEGVLVADRAGRVVVVNAAARTILGLPDVGRNATDMVHSLEVHDVEDRPLVTELRPLMRALRGEQFSDYEVVRLRPNGDHRRVVSTGTSVRDQDGNVALAIVVFRDVTELKRLEQQRDEYLALISHDLRNPLAVVLMCLATLKRSVSEASTPRVRSLEPIDLVERAERNARRMSVMLDELKEATSLETQSVALRRAPCDMSEIVANVIDSLDDARARRIAIQTDHGSGYVVLGDAARLERVVANLLTNALKYSAGDTPVTVRLDRTDRAIELDVVDRGIGIPPENRRRLFERYYRTAAGEARASGLGLGLYIASMIAELHGGRIDVFSEVGKGSTFRLTLPSPVR